MFLWKRNVPPDPDPTANHDWDREEADRLAETTNFAKFLESASSVAVGAIDRARASAELVQKASTAIAALYTGVLALVFSVTSNPLPLRGVLTPVFLGWAVVASTAYVAYMTSPRPDEAVQIQPEAALEPKSIAWLRALIALTTTMVVRRSFALRSGVVSLGVGLAYIALPFVSLGGAAGAGTATPWPPVPSGGSVDLQKILYQAQVTEAAGVRAKEAVPSPTDDLGVTIVCLLVGLAVVLVVPALSARNKPAPTA